jgi:hypothetical protein
MRLAIFISGYARTLIFLKTKCYLKATAKRRLAAKRAHPGGFRVT